MAHFLSVYFDSRISTRTCEFNIKISTKEETTTNSRYVVYYLVTYLLSLVSYNVLQSVETVNCCKNFNQKCNFCGVIKHVAPCILHRARGCELSSTLIVRNRSKMETSCSWQPWRDSPRLQLIIQNGTTARRTSERKRRTTGSAEENEEEEGEELEKEGSPVLAPFLRFYVFLIIRRSILYYFLFPQSL